MSLQFKNVSEREREREQSWGGGAGEASGLKGLAGAFLVEVGH